MSVYKRSGHWYFTKTIRGVRYRRALPTARTKAMAEEAERKELDKIHRGEYGRPSGSTLFSDFAESVYLPWAKENNRSTNHAYHVATFKAYFKRRTFAEITPLLIEKFKSDRRKTPTKHGALRKPSSVNRELACLSAIFSLAIEKRLISENPCFKVKKLVEHNRRERYLSAEEEARLLDACTGARSHLRPIILMAVNTGMRRGEILSLRWSQVDLSRGMIHGVGTKSGKRDVPINRAVRELLLSLRGSSPDVIFRSNKTGDALTHFNRAFASAKREAEISDLRFHDLRHTAATRMGELGAEMSTIKEILGHADLRMTDRYTHAVARRKREALERISGYGDSNPDSNVIEIRERREA